MQLIGSDIPLACCCRACARVLHNAEPQAARAPGCSRAAGRVGASGCEELPRNSPGGPRGAAQRARCAACHPCAAARLLTG
jgi:hypothetical protein